MPNTAITTLGPGNIHEIVALERSSFQPALQAGDDLLRQRFALGHRMLGVYESGELVAMTSFSFARFSPKDRDSFPRTFRAFSTTPAPADFNAAFLYNLEVAHQRRGRGHARALLIEAFDQANEAGCIYAVGDGRVSSYRGRDDRQVEQVRSSHTIKRAIDRHMRGGAFPTKEEFLSDPTLALYHRLTGCEFLWIMNDFCPEDRAAGGYRVIVYGELASWRLRRDRKRQRVSSVVS